MKKEAEIGDICFWNTVIQDYKDKAKTEKRLKYRIRLAKCLNEARGYLKYAESKILVALLLAILFCSGCGEIIQSAGHLCNAGGQALSFTGDHLTQTVAKEK